MNRNCLERVDSTVSPQALYLMNNAQVHQLAEAFAERIRREAGEDPAGQIERLYWIALGRPPSAEERGAQRLARKRLNEAFRNDSSGAPSVERANFRALTKQSHTLLNSAAFLYID